MSLFELMLRLVCGALLLMANGMFVTTEFAMTRLRQFDSSEFQQRRNLRLAWTMTEQLEIYLTACQVGITVTSILLGVVFEPGVTELIRPFTALLGLSQVNTAWVSVALAVLLIQFTHTVWGEQTPTYLGVEKPKQVVAVFAPVIYGWTWVMYPAIYLGDHVAKATLAILGITLERSWTEEGEQIEDKADLRRQIGILLSKGEVPEDRREEVLNALRLDEITVRDIMVPWSEVRSLHVGEPRAKQETKLRRNTHTRLPLVKNGEPVGMVYIPALLQQLEENPESNGLDLSSAASPPFFVPSDLPVSQYIDELQEAEQEVAMVRADGDVVGLVTETDAFETVVGELRDPLDKRE